MSENEKRWLKHVYHQHEVMCKETAQTATLKASNCDDEVIKIENVYTAAPFGSANIE